MNIYKNFLNEKDFKVLESKMMGDTFPWYYNNEVVNKGDEFFQFTYVFVVNGKENYAKNRISQSYSRTKAEKN